jgi:hypothetical protein
LSRNKSANRICPRRLALQFFMREGVPETRSS